MSLYFYLKRRIFTEKGIYPDYTPQFRLEARSRTAEDDSNALAMRIADPLWMLGRQWQFGEFQAEDNGSPIQIETFFNKKPVRYCKFTPTGDFQSVGDIPLEARVEAMDIPFQTEQKPQVELRPTEIDLKSKVRIRQRFERMVKDVFGGSARQLLGDIRKEYPLKHNGKIDPGSRRFYNLMKGKVLDGGFLMHTIKTNTTLWKSGNGSPNKELREISTQLEKWFDNFYVLPGKDSAWTDKNLAHDFHLFEDEKIQDIDFVLHAPDYQSGHLDWYSFDTASVRLGQSNSVTRVGPHLPVNVSFPSMPDKRLFAFEDAKIDLTKMDIEPGDLLKTMLIDFSFVSGSDWFTIPLDMRLGEACWVEKIEVKDVFGVTTEVRNGYEDPAKKTDLKGPVLNTDGLRVWDMFKIRNKNLAENEYNPDEHFLFLAPATTMRMESEPLEELLFVRDEYSNMVWAIERRLTNAMGKPVDGFDLHLDVNGPFQTPDEGTNPDMPIYRLASTVPSNWIPFIPRHAAGSSTEIVLKKADMMLNEDDNEPSPVPALSFMLSGGDIETVREEAVPRAGVRVQITNQRVRWTNGKTYVWRGRKVLAGKGEGNSGLRFDYLRE